MNTHPSHQQIRGREWIFLMDLHCKTDMPRENGHILCQTMNIGNASKN
jgi:hypothetical protein